MVTLNCYLRKEKPTNYFYRLEYKYLFNHMVYLFKYLKCYVANMLNKTVHNLRFVIFIENKMHFWYC